MSQSGDRERRFRTIPKAVQQIKEQDPDSAITEYGVRLAIKKDQIRFKNIGKRIVVDMEEVKNYYSGMDVGHAGKRY